MKRHPKRRSPQRRRAGSYFRKQGRAGRPVRATQRRLSQIEVLEDRRVLDANALASFEAELDNAAKMPELRLDVAGGGSSDFIGLRMTATNGGSIDPGEIVIQNGDGDPITPWISLADVNGSTDSFLLVRLSDGQYPVILSSDGGTGSFRVDAFLPGDLDDGVVSDHEFQMASSSLIQDFETNVNHVSQIFFRQLNINLLQDQYDQAFDANMNGEIDPFDIDRLRTNMNHPPVTLSFAGEVDPPEVTLEMTDDTGSDLIDGSFDDGITSFTGVVDEVGGGIGGDEPDQEDDDGVLDPIFVGTLKDASEVESFQASIDNRGPIDISELLEPGLGDPDTGTDAVFSLTLDDLNRIFNLNGTGTDTVENTGSHTLQILAGDEWNNNLGVGVGDAPLFEFPFEIDTDVPGTGVAPNLIVTSDTGANDGRFTQDRTPTIRVEGENGDVIRLNLGTEVGDQLGFGTVVNGDVLITVADELPDGDHTIVATAIDTAGNVGEAYLPLTITVDNSLPMPVLTLNGAVTGDLVDLPGLTDAGAEVSLTVNGDPVATTATAITVDNFNAGQFTLTDVPFPPNSLDPVLVQLTATDLAGNTGTSPAETVERNLPPEEAGSIDPVTALEDDDEVTGIDLSGLFTDPENQDLTFSASSNNTTLVQTTVDNNTDTLSLTFQPDANGTTTVTITGTDPGGLFATFDLTVTVEPVNDAPTVANPIVEVVLNEDASDETIDLNNVFDDIDDASLSYSVFSNDNPGLVDASVAGGTLTLSLQSDQVGSAEIMVLATDGGGLTATDTFTVMVNAVNDAPSFSLPIEPNQEIDEGTTDLQTVLGFASNMLPGGGADESAQVLTFALTVDDPSLFEVGSEPAIDAMTGDLTYQIADPDTFGMIEVTVELMDDGGTDNGGQDTSGPQMFTINIVDENDPPTAVDDLDLIVTIGAENTLRVLVNDTDAPDEGETLTITNVTSASNGAVSISDDMQSLLYEPNDTLPVDTTDVFIYTISDGRGGTDSAAVSVIFTDDGLLANSDSFGIDPLVLEDSAPVELDVLTNDQAPDIGAVSIVNVTEGDQGGSISHNGSTITYEPASDFFGTETFSYTIEDGTGASDTTDVMVDVTAVNDAPEFNLPGTPDQNIAEGTTSLQTVAGFATNLTVGGGSLEEALGQSLTNFLVTTNNDSLFSVLPSIDVLTGDLTYQISGQDTNGSAEITVRLMDDGGTDNGGDDTSDSQTFDITVDDVNDAPIVANSINDLNLNDVDESNPPSAGAQPAPIDLDNVFFDPDNNLAYEIVSNSNPDLVDVSLNNNVLTVNYLPYASDQDRTPATVVVRATEVGGDGLTVEETFIVSVDPQKTFEVHLVVLNAPSTPQAPNFDFQVDQLPTSIDSVPIGQGYVVEIYLRDLLVPDLIAGTNFSTSASGAFVDMQFNQNLNGTVAPEDWKDVGEFSQSDATPPIVGNGIIEQIGGIQPFGSAGLGLDPQYVRLGYMEFTAAQAGQQNYQIHLDADNQTTLVGRFGNGVIGDDVDNNQIETFDVSVNHTSEIVTLNINAAQSEIEVGGTFGNNALTPQQAGVSDTPQLSGTIRLEVDDLDDPTLLRILDANVDWETTGEWSPTNGSENSRDNPNVGTDPAVFGFSAETTISGPALPITFAGRDFTTDISSPFISLGTNGTFDASEWSWQLTSGEIDQHLGSNPEPSIGGANDGVTGLALLPNATPAASLINGGGTLTLTLPVAHHLTANITGESDLELDFTNGSIVATFDVPGTATASASEAPSHSAPLMLEDAVLGDEPLDLSPVAVPTDELADTVSVFSTSSRLSLELSAVLAQNGIALQQPELLMTIILPEEIRPAYFGEIGTSADGDPSTDDELATTSLEEQLTSVDAIFSDWLDPLN